MPTNGLSCGECLRHLPPFERVLAPWRYAFPLDGVITRFKHQGDRPLGRLCAQLLARHLEEAFDAGLQPPDLLLPVPLAVKRQRQRGFNQAELLARRLAGDLGLDCRTPLRRVRETPPQQGLDAATRKRNLRQAFSLDQGTALRGLHLALVDDVLTTGATAAALARLLRQAGAARVDVYCLARTGKPG